LKLSGERFIFKYIGLFVLLKKRKDEYKKELDQTGNTENSILRSKIENLRSENSMLKNQLSSFRTSDEKSPEKNTENKFYEWRIDNSKQPIQKLFFSMPEDDGCFIVKNGVPSNDGSMYYRIEYNDNNDQGKLFYLPGDRDRRAINRLESYLKPVCDIENIINASSASRIDFLSPGKVVLINDNWMIDNTNKVKIKLL